MFEIVGAITKPVPSLWPIVLAAAPLLVTVLSYAGPSPRRRAIVVLVACALADLVPCVGERVLITHAGVAARVGELELTLALGVDLVSGAAAAVTCLVGAVLVGRQGTEARRRIALVGALTSAVCVMVLADGAPTLVLGAAASSFIGAALGRASGPTFVADRVTEIAVVGAAAVTFWSLGGTWIDGAYLPQLDPRVVVVRSAPSAPSPVTDDDDELRVARTRGGQAWLSFVGLPGSAVAVDGHWLPTRTPFADVPIAPGPHTVRVHVGGGSDDYFVPRMSPSDGEHVWLSSQGATTSFRELRDALSTPLASTFARRQLEGQVPVSAVILTLVALAFAGRLRLFPFAPSVSEPARALTMLGGVAIARALGVAQLVPREAAAVASVLALCACIGWLRRSDARGLLGAELSLVLPAFIAGAPLVGVLHAGMTTVILHRPYWPSRVRRLALLPTHALVIGVLYRMPHGGLPALVTLAATSLLFVSDALVGRLAGRADELVSIPTRAIATAVRFLGHATVALEGAVLRTLDQLYRAARAAGSVAGAVEDLVLIASPSSLPPPRVLKLAVVPMVLAAIVVFALPWLA